MDLNEVENKLKTTPFFKDFNHEEFQKIFNECLEKKLSPGDAFLKEDQPSSELYILLEGEAVITKKSVKKNQPHKLVSLNQCGDIIGELSVFNNGLTSASVSAVTPLTLIALPSKNIHRLASQDLALYLKFTNKLIGILTNRIRDSNTKLVQKLEVEIARKDKRIKIADFLAYSAFGLLFIIIAINFYFRFR